MSRETKLALLSAALDLKRVTTGYQNGSEKMSDKFTDEAIRWLNHIHSNEVDSYIYKIVKALPKKLSTNDRYERAEIALTYSTILQNYAIGK